MKISSLKIKMTLKEPFISIIIVEYYYPKEKFIRCMRSYTNQDYENYEIILILWGKKEFNNDTSS
ncbi:hypothetical protein LCGC14_2607160 [marine sediment metagenome]|uniref:Uncharacterized protein n=1 Tax=marine sediment metagenome TaxID=412755 RepID=A0A0F9AUL8_9ZZZZ